MAEATSPRLVVKTALCGDVNLVQAGTPLEIRVSIADQETSEGTKATVGSEEGDVEKKEEAGGGVRGEGEEEEAEPITAVAAGKQLGEAEVDIREESEGTYLVRLVPNTPDEYTLDVKHHDHHVPGSPFTILAIGKDSPSTDGEEETAEQLTVTAGSPVSFLIAVDSGKQGLAVSVVGSSGVCESLISDECNGMVAVKFTPNVAGNYTISVKENDSDITNSPFQITAKGITPDASKCYIVEDDTPIFKKPIRFGGQPARFRVSTANAGHGNLSIISQGPARADVKTFTDGDDIESCEFTPSMPGKYYIDVLWGGVHIPSSPYLLHFRRGKTKIVSDGLNLQTESYHINVPHRFKLNCSGVGEGGLQLTCEPQNAAVITITPASEERAFICQILPKVVGGHAIGVTYKKKHIGGSPFSVHFSPDASKCRMVEGSDEHDIGGSVQFLISTAEAGAGGELTATVFNKSTETTIPVSISQLTEDQYRVEFNPGEVMECRMEVYYDNEHIRGSPFNLLFSDPSCCRAEGQGLQSAECDKLSRFTVVTKNAGPGILRATIEGEDGLKVDPTITAIEGAKFEVSYYLSKPGKYRIRVQWGKFDIPGSPFEVFCYEMTHFQVKDLPTEIHLGSQITFTVEGSTEMASIQADRERPVGELTVNARSTKGAEVKGQVEQDSSGHFTCRLQPTVSGKYNVSVRWNGTHLQGSPFRVKVATPPIPERVKVHGPGLEDGFLGKEGNFTVETADAGTGLLAVRVHGPKGAFKINTRRDNDRPRSILVNYNPSHTGTYVIEITWAGVDIPGSPYRVVVSNPPEDRGEVGGSGGRTETSVEVEPREEGGAEAGAEADQREEGGTEAGAEAEQRDEGGAEAGAEAEQKEEGGAEASGEAGQKEEGGAEAGAEESGEE